MTVISIVALLFGLTMVLILTISMVSVNDRVGSAALTRSRQAAGEFEAAADHVEQLWLAHERGIQSIPVSDNDVGGRPL